MLNKNDFSRIKERMVALKALKISLAALAIFILGFMIAPAFIAEASAANHVGSTISWDAVFLTLDPDKEATDAAITAAGGESLSAEEKQAIINNVLTNDSEHGDIEFGTIIPTARTENNRGTMMVKKKTINVITTGKYYSVYLSTASSSNALDMVTSASGSEAHSSFSIPSTTGTFASPTQLGAVSSWGFAIPGVDETGIESAPSTFVAPRLTDTQIYYASEDSNATQTYNNTVWAAVPTSSNAQQIWKNTTSHSISIN